MSLTKVSNAMMSSALISILDYGADSTGANDSTNAIQAAIDAASAQGGGIVKIPYGQYLVSELVFNGSQVMLEGDVNAYTLSLIHI